MQRFHAKQIERKNDKSKCKNTLSPSSDDEKLRQLELLLDEKLCQRFQIWCRACASEHCCMEKPSKEAQVVTGEDHATHLQTFRNKRLDFEKCIDQADKLVSSCRYGILHSRCHPTCEDQLPIWLHEILGVGFTLPLVPTFPTSASAFEALCSGAGVRDLNTQLRDEYLEAASFVRRLVVVGGEQLNSKHTRLANVLIKEEISQGYHVNQQKSSLDRKEPSKHGDDSSLTKVLLETTTKIPTNKDDLDTREGNHGFILQELENQMIWTGAYCCANSEIEECGQERALIKGHQRRTGVEYKGVEPVGLPFKLILLLGDRQEGNVRIKGTFLRKTASSRFDLRWKFNVTLTL